jgi:hypothetical protein
MFTCEQTLPLNQVLQYSFILKTFCAFEQRYLVPGIVGNIISSLQATSQGPVPLNPWCDCGMMSVGARLTCSFVSTRDRFTVPHITLRFSSGPAFINNKGKAFLVGFARSRVTKITGERISIAVSSSLRLMFGRPFFSVRMMFYYLRSDKMWIFLCTRSVQVWYVIMRGIDFDP